MSLVIFTYSLFFCPQAGSPINGYQKPPWGQKPGAWTRLLFLFPPSANQKITTKCLCVWLTLWNISKSLFPSQKNLEKHTCEIIRSLFFFHYCSSVLKRMCFMIYEWIKHCTLWFCPPFAVTHAHHMCPTFPKSHFPVIVHYSDLVINTTNKRKSTWECSFVVLPVNPHRGSTSWCAEETTNVVFRPKWSPTDCSPTENLVHLDSDDQISSLITWLSLVRKNLKKKKVSEVLHWLRSMMTTQRLHHVWTIWCTHGVKATTVYRQSKCLGKAIWSTDYRWVSIHLFLCAFTICA